MGGGGEGCGHKPKRQNKKLKKKKKKKPPAVMAAACVRPVAAAGGCSLSNAGRIGELGEVRPLVQLQ